METRAKGKLRIIRNTFLKPSSRQASETTNIQMVPMKVGDVIEYDAIDINHFSHYCLEAVTPISGYKRWYIFQGHAEIVGNESNTDIKPVLPSPTVNTDLIQIKGVPFLAQYDNDYAASSSCFLTCISMVLTYLGHKSTNPKIQLEDELFIKAQNTGINRFDGYSLCNLVESLGYKCQFTQQGSTNDIKNNIRNNIPCILGTYMTSAGHIICLLGFCDKEGYYLAHDPWGKCISQDNYDFQAKGDYIKYPYTLVNKLGSPESENNPRDFWIMTITRKQ